MANENVLNVRLRGDLGELTTTLNAGITVLKNFGKNTTAVVDDVKKSFQGFQGVGGNIVKNFDEIAAGAAVLSKVNAAIDAAAASALSSSSSFQTFGKDAAAAFNQAATAAGKSSTGYALSSAAIGKLTGDLAVLSAELKRATDPSDVTRLKNAIAEINVALANVKGQRIEVIDPSSPALLNNVSASLTRIGPAAAAITAGLQTAGQSIDQFAGKSLQSAQNVDDFGARVATAISQIKGSAAGMLQVTSVINEVGIAARNAGEGFFAIGVQKPLQEINILRANVNQLKSDLASGFKANISVVDPKTPALLNSISALLTNIAPAINSSNAALQGASNSAKVFAVSVNKSLADAVSRFEAFKAEALSLSTVFTNIPVTLRPDTKVGLEELRQTVSILKQELSEANLTIPAPKITPPNLDATKRTFSDFNIVINRTLEDSVKSFDKFKVEALQLGSTFNKIPSSLKPFNLSSIVALRGAVKGLKVDLLDLKFKNVDDQFKSVSRSAVTTGQALRNGVTPGANSAGQALQNVGRIAQDLPFGFIGIQNNINPLLESFQRLKLESGSTGKAIKALAGSLIGAGGIGLALSVVSAAFLIYQNGIAGFNKSSKEAKEVSDAYADSLKSIVTSLAEEATRVSALVGALKSDTLTRKEKVAAIDELKRINPTYFGQLKEETGLINGLQNAYVAYLSALKKQFAAKAIDKQIAGLFDKKLELEIDIDPKLSSLKQLSPQTLAQIAEIEARLKELPKVDFTKINIDEPLTKAQQEVSRLQERLIKLRQSPFILDPSDQLTSKSKELDSVNKQIDSLIAKRSSVGKVDLDLNLGGKGKADTKKEDAVLASLTSNLKSFKEELAAIQELRKGGILPVSLADDALKLQEDIQKIEDQIDKREVELKIKPRVEIDPRLADLELKKFTDEFREGTGSEINIPIIPQPVLNDRSFNTKLQKAVNANLEANELAGIDLKLPITLNLTEASNITTAFDKILPANFNQPMIDKLTQAGKDGGEAYGNSLSQSLSEISSTGVADAFAALGEGIGSALSSGENPIIAAARSFLSVIGSVLQQIGKEIIVASTLVVALKKALQAAFTNPTASLIVGIALVAAGSALKNIKFNVPKLAEGGITTGPTLALIGESGREAVIPLNRGGDFLGGGAQEIIVTGQIHGDVIKLIYDKAANSQKRRF